MPAHPCSKTTAGNGPGPVGRSSHAGTVSGMPGVAFGNERFVVAQPAIRIEAQSTDSGRRSMNRAYTVPQRAAKRERLGGAASLRRGFWTPQAGYARRHTHPVRNGVELPAGRDVRTLWFVAAERRRPPTAG